MLIQLLIWGGMRIWEWVLWVGGVQLNAKWLVDPKLPFVGPRIGEGVHAKVYEGKYKNQNVAFKIVHKGETPEQITQVSEWPTSQPTKNDLTSPFYIFPTSTCTYDSRFALFWETCGFPSIFPCILVFFFIVNFRIPSSESFPKATCSYLFNFSMLVSKLLFFK